MPSFPAELQLGDAVLSPRAAQAGGFPADGEIRRSYVRINVAARVIQVQTSDPMADALAANAGVLQALPQFAILTAVAHSLVKPVRLKDVRLPAGSVVPVPAGGGRGNAVQ